MGGWLPVPSHLPTFTKQSSSPPSNPKIYYFTLLVVALQYALAGESRLPSPQFVGISCPCLAWLEKIRTPRTGTQLPKVAAQMLGVLPSALSLGFVLCPRGIQICVAYFYCSLFHNYLREALIKLLGITLNKYTVQHGDFPPQYYRY